MDQNAEVPQAAQSASQSGNMSINMSINVSIYDQVYHLRGTDPAHIEELAAIVDAKMRAVSAHGNTVDSLRVAVLASLNIADELAMMRARYDELTGTMQHSQHSLRSRADTLAEMLDEVLEGAGSRKAG
ncbi:MAG: cell division protein ZapA [Granulicella sp.]